MIYIREDMNGFMSYDKYFQYLESKKNEMKPDIYAFASDPSRHDLSSRGSLHDAWLDSIFFRAKNYIYNDIEAQPDLTLNLLGPFHDRVHVLKYFEIKDCKLTNFDFFGNAREADLLYHEVRQENNLVEHEIVFDREIVIEITCASMRHAERLL
ncbi:hypothetical protein [Amantichitinum ursilacus]|uniref:Uncharacterized protein n=1 Tax=Amantichitinum ursilacus TaxID=857265 RepID=A0A0N1JRT9_9NEIS|nr:hypothetical protein [Amantichitinum ursilacus]KPC49930.1 hypothetical protein WG78_18780 [Amantichitinum ursilacus]